MKLLINIVQVIKNIITPDKINKLKFTALEKEHLNYLILLYLFSLHFTINSLKAKIIKASTSKLKATLCSLT